MRRVGFAVTVALGLALTAAPAAADPTPAPGASALLIPVPSATPGTSVCTISDRAAVGISGLVATGSGYVVIDGVNAAWGQLRVVYLDRSCARDGPPQAYTGTGAIDPQDLAIDSFGTLWVADTGDTNPANPTRELISLWKVPARTGAMTHYKFSYPDGPHNAQAVLLDGTGAPIFITKNVTGPAGIYTYTDQLVTTTTMRLTKVGQFQPEQTGTPNKLGANGQAQNSVTGGADSPDGSRVAVRTLSDAYEWDVTGGNVVNALTKGTPRITPLPSEDQGYAIAYTTDGKSFLTLSSSDSSTPLLKYAPARATPTSASTAKPKTPKTPKKPGVIRRWFNSLTLSQLMWYLGGVAAFGLLLVGLGIFGMVRSRRRPPPPPKEKAGQGPLPGPGGPQGARPPAPLGPAVGAASTPGVYGAPRGSATPNHYPEYGADGRPVAPAYDPYGSERPASGRYGADPYADPYAAPGPSGVPPGGAYQGAANQGAANQGGANQGGGSQGGGYQGGGANAAGQYGGGQYGGGQRDAAQYGSPGPVAPGGAAGPRGSVYGGPPQAGVEYGAADNGGSPYQGGQYAGADYAGSEYGAPVDPYQDDAGYPRPDARKPAPYGRPDANARPPDQPDDYAGYRG